MDIDGAILRHCPNDFGEHAECHNYLDVSMEVSQLVEECLIFKGLRLEDFKTFLFCEDLDGRWAKLLTSTGRFVWHSDYANDLVPSV